MKTINKISVTALLCLFGLSAFSQNEVEMADSFRADGKIYVVVTIILVVLLGFVGYLFLLDRKLTKVEREFDAKSKETK